MQIYIDENYKCNLTDGRQFEVPFFDGKCRTFVEGYRYVPSGETWTRTDGIEFHGEMISPWKSYSILAEAQRNYEEGVDSQDTTIAELMDTIEELCEEIIENG